MAEHDKRATGKIEPSSVMAVLFIFVFIGGVVYLLTKTITSTSPLRKEGELFFTKLRDGRTEEAYRRLAKTRRLELDYGDFLQQTSLPVLQKQREVDFTATRVSDGGWGCTRGDLEADDGEWGFELFFVREGETWRVYSWALHPPALIQKIPLIKRCGQY